MYNQIKLLILFVGFIFIINSNNAQSKSDSLRNELQVAIEDSSKLNLLQQLGDIYVNINIDSSIVYYKNALVFAENLDRKDEIAQSYIDLGIAFEKKNDFAQSLQYYLKALNVSNELGDKEKLSLCYNYLGDSYTALNSYANALEHYTKAISLYRELNDENGISIVLINLGNIYYEKKEYEKARSYYGKALKICERLGDKFGVSTCYINIGNVLSDNGQYSEGIEYYNKALKIEEQNKTKEGLASIYNNIGDTYLNKKDYSWAMIYLLESLKISEELEDVSLIAISCLNIAMTKFKQGKYKEAIDFANRSIFQSKQIDALSYEAECYSILAQVNEKLKDYKQAYVNQCLFKQINDSIFNVEKQKRFEQLDALYNLERNQQEIKNLVRESEFKESQLKQQRIIIVILLFTGIIVMILMVLLYRQHQERSKTLKQLSVQKEEIQTMHDEMEKQRDFLDELNATKDKFFSIIAHDLKNPFNSIVGFSNLMIENFHENSTEDSKKFLNLIRNSSTQALNLLQNLLLWARSQTGNLDFNPEPVNLNNRLVETISLLEIQAAKKNINISAQCYANCYILADKNMLDTILRNLLSNAVKYTKEGGSVKVFAESVNGYCQIIVKDNGVGISKENIQKLFIIESKFTHLGTANEQGSGLGLILCKDFVNRQGGKIWAKSEPGQGSEFIFTIPKA